MVIIVIAPPCDDENAFIKLYWQVDDCIIYKIKKNIFVWFFE